MKKIFVLLLGLNFLSGCTAFCLSKATAAPNRDFEDRLPYLQAVFLNEESLENFNPAAEFARAEDPMAERFYREVEANLIEPGEKKGYLVLLPQMNIARNGASLYTFLSVVTLGLSPALGLPITTFTSVTDLELNVLNAQGELIKQYTSQAFVQNKVGFYHGDCNSAHNCYTKVAWEGYERTLDNIIKQVYKDRAYLKEQLN